MLLRERMGSKKLLVKQKGVAEAFASGRDAFVSFPIIYSIAVLPRMHFHSIDILLRRVSLSCRYGLNSTQFLINGENITHKPWPIRRFCSYIAKSYVAVTFAGFTISCQAAKHVLCQINRGRGKSICHCY